MLKKLTIIIVILFASNRLHAQTTGKIYEDYLEFNYACFHGETDKAFKIGQALLDSVGSLPPKAQTSFYNRMGKLYEDSKAFDKAIFYYEKVAAAVPNYYVVHLALGYLYLKPVNSLQAQLNGLKKGSPEDIKLKASYKTAALKAVQHLEIGQACDPDAQTLTIIKTIYTNIGDTAALKSLDQRLAANSKNCLDLLSDQ